MSETEFTTVRNKNNYKKMENDLQNLQRKIYSPKVDLISLDNYFKVRIELPGVEKSTIKIQIKEQQIILISGIRNSEFNDLENSKVIYSETRYGNFIRRVKLPEVIKPFYFNANDCNLKNGVLYLQFEKQAEKQAEKQFEKQAEKQAEKQPEKKLNWADEI